MDNQGMELNELMDKVRVELRNTGYSDSYIRGLCSVWNRLVDYMDRNGNTIFTAKVGMNFLETEYGITVYKKLDSEKKNCARAVNLLIDYLLHGIIFPRTKQSIRTFHPQFQMLFQGYIDKKRAYGMAEDTLQSYAIYLSRFSDYLNSRGIVDIRSMDEITVIGFTDTFIRYSPSMIHTTLCTLRTFFHYLYQTGFVSKDFAYIVPHDGYRQRTKVPSAYPKEDVENLLRSIDRGNPKGKRDYAMILIAGRLGLRAQDICDLSFNNLKWETNTIELLQEKTETPIVLPLLEDVGMAIIDYLKYGRPNFDFTNTIFLRLTPPLGKLQA
jgi:integrase/recombinase XerD